MYKKGDKVKVTYDARFCTGLRDAVVVGQVDKAWVAVRYAKGANPCIVSVKQIMDDKNA